MVIDNKKIYSRLSLRAKKVLANSVKLANNEPVKPEHILVSLLLEVDSLAVSALKVAGQNPITLIVMLGFGSYLAGYLGGNTTVVTESLSIKDVEQDPANNTNSVYATNIHTDENAKDGMLDDRKSISDNKRIISSIGENINAAQINSNVGLNAHDDSGVVSGDMREKKESVGNQDEISIGDAQHTVSSADLNNVQDQADSSDNIDKIDNINEFSPRNLPKALKDDFDMDKLRQIIDGIKAIDGLGTVDLNNLGGLKGDGNTDNPAQNFADQNITAGNYPAGNNLVQKSDLNLQNQRLDLNDDFNSQGDNIDSEANAQSVGRNNSNNSGGNVLGDIDFLGDLDGSLIDENLMDYSSLDEEVTSSSREGENGIGKLQSISDQNNARNTTGNGPVKNIANQQNVNGVISGDESLLFQLDPEKLNLTMESKIILSIAFQLASKHDLVYVGTEHLMLALLTQKDLQIVKELANRGLTLENYLKALSSIASYPIGLLAKPDGAEHARAHTPMLSQIGVDLVELAYKGKLDPLVGRQEEIDQLINILSRRKKNNPIIVGEAGVGKTVLVEGLAQRISAGQVPGSLIGMRIIALDITNIIAGSKMRGDVEEKVMQIVNEAKSNRDIILFIDEIQNILNTSMPGGGMDIATILKPALVSGMIKCIGATTSEDFSRFFEEDEALLRRFHPVYIDEPSIADSIEILKKIKPILEEHHVVKISDEAVIASVKLSDRYISDRYLPDKAIDLLDEATASRRLESEVKYEGLVDMELKLNETIHNKEMAVKNGDLEKAKAMRDLEKNITIEIENLNKKRLSEQYGNKFSVGVDTVRKVIAKWTGIPIETIDRDETKSLLNLDKLLSQNVIGQDEAVKSVANAIKRARAGISSPDRPWASFMFLGPTGVGKTELAKVLTKVLFGDDDRLIQVDMSELMEMHSVSKLIGSPPGYVGYREGGQLTEAVKKNPHSVILFDEIEKAHPDVLNILLQVLEYGHLKDGKGKRINFKNTVIIMTSNIGAEEIRRNKIAGFTDKRESEQRDDIDIEKSYDSMKEGLMKQLKESLRPELLNRLDDIVIFRSLNRKDAKKIVNLLIEDLNNRLVEERVNVVIDESAIKKIVKDGFSEEYGARPLRRLIQDRVETIVAEYILKRGHRNIKDKIEDISVHFVKEEFVIKKRK